MLSRIIIFLFLSSLNICLTDDNIQVTFLIWDPKIEIPEENDIKTIVTKPNSSEFIPTTKLKKSGYTFWGWTADGIHGYEPNDVFRTGTENMAFKPLFTDNNDNKYYKYDYYSECDGEIIDVSQYVSEKYAKKDQIIKPELINLVSEKGKHIGWRYNGYDFLPEAKMVMPANDVTFEAIWHRYHILTYLAGDVDGIIGATKAVFDLREGGKKELAESNRFARIGYNIIGWHCDYDGLDYKVLQSYTMPDADVNFYAIWEPINYNVVFNPKVTGVASIKIRGLTKTTIICPEVNCVNEGYTFAGWKYEDKIYMPGDEFLIEGAMPGLGILLKGTWVPN